MIKTVFLVPEFDNEGARFPFQLFTEIEDRLAEAFGGYTRQGGLVGVWRHEGRVYRDRSFQYTVSLAHWTELPRWLEIVSWVRQAFRQEAIYIEVAGVPDFMGAD